jgi:hypothetical protein
MDQSILKQGDLGIVHVGPLFAGVKENHPHRLPALENPKFP